MRLNKSTKIPTLDTCSQCEGKGALPDDIVKAGIKCMDCDGTGKLIITVGDVFDLVYSELSKELRRGLH